MDFATFGEFHLCTHHHHLHSTHITTSHQLPPPPPLALFKPSPPFHIPHFLCAAFFSAPNSPIHTITVKVPSSRLPSKKQLTFQTRTTFKSLPNSAPQPCSTTTAGRFIWPPSLPPAAVPTDRRREYKGRPSVRRPFRGGRGRIGGGRRRRRHFLFHSSPPLVRPMENCWANKEGGGEWPVARMEQRHTKSVGGKRNCDYTYGPLGDTTSIRT